jgi:glycosyltransferase involved in cell wall biosynthesis
MNQKKICYLTYQSFPAETANSQQTISNIIHLTRNNRDVKLIFPLREKNSSDSIEKIKKVYNFNENFSIQGVSHNYPFGKVNNSSKALFHISHYLWAKKITKKILSSTEHFDYFITRSDWVFYFLSKNNRSVAFEIHQISKIRKLILLARRNAPNSKLIFLNEILQRQLKNYTSLQNSIVLHNGVDMSSFENLSNKQKEIVFVGSLKRFNKDRNLRFLIEAFNISDLVSTHKLKIIGGPQKSAEELRDYVSKKYSELSIEINGRLSRFDAIERIKSAEIGVLLNEGSNDHSKYYTSPLKYFEYLAGNLKIIASDVPAHKCLPYSKDILFYKDGHTDSLKDALNKSLAIKVTDFKKNDISLDMRAKKIISFLEN